jgi:lipoprotein NlpI
MNRDNASRRKIVILSEAQADAVAEYIAARQKELGPSYNFSHDHRAILMRGIGRKDLAKRKVQPGRPKTEGGE